MTSPGAPNALFSVDGAAAHPSELARGPWSPDTLHGGAIAALVAALVDGRAGLAGGHIARLTLDVLRPVPRAPLTARVRALREGRRVARFDVSVRAAGELVARATALRVHPAAAELLPAAEAAAPPPGPDRGLAHAEACTWRAFNSDAIELRHAADDANVTGATAWVRMLVPVIADRDLTPAVRAAAAADLTSGIGAALRSDRFHCINADLVLHLHRLPVGEWIAIRALTHVGCSASAIAEAQLYDTNGRIGCATQTVIVRAAERC